MHVGIDTSIHANTTFITTVCVRILSVTKTSEKERHTKNKTSAFKIEFYALKNRLFLEQFIETVETKTENNRYASVIDDKVNDFTFIIR